VLKGWRVLLLLPLMALGSIALFLSISGLFYLRSTAEDSAAEDASSSLGGLTLPVTETSGLWGHRIMQVNNVPGEFVQELADELENWRIINPYVCAILMIDDFGVKEPVIQARVSNRQWLRTNILGEADINGSVFVDYRCNLESNAVKMIHGHNMSDGTVFGQLPNLLFCEDCKDMPEVKLYTDNGLQVYRPYAAFSVSSKEEALPLDSLMKYDDVVETTDEFLERSWVKGGEITSLDTLVLNTCWYGESGKEHNLHCIVVFSRV